MKILALDLETAPNQAFVWGLYKQTIASNQVMNSGYILCWAAHWIGSKSPVMFDSVHKSKPTAMLRRIHRLLDEADAAVTYYGNNFDLPTLNKEFVEHGMTPPSPYHRIDLCQVVQREFQFPSTKLDFVCKALGLGQKIRHTGFDLWVATMRGDAKAWRLMERYNKMDVMILERLYARLLPWIKSHPNHRLYDDGALCPNCGGVRHQSRGHASTKAFRYRRYQCLGCGTWFRSTKSSKLPGGGERYVQVQ